MGTRAVIALVNSLLLASTGSDAVASYTLITQVTLLCYLPLSALVMGFAPIAGFSFGAQDTKRLASLVKPLCAYNLFSVCSCSSRSKGLPSQSSVCSSRTGV